MEDHKEELMMEEFDALQGELKDVLVEEHSTEEDGEEISSEVIKSIMEKWMSTTISLRSTTP